MTPKELLISRISSNYIRFKYEGETFKLISPTVGLIYEANEVYQEVYEDSLRAGVMSMDDSVKLLTHMGEWTIGQEGRVDDIKGEIEDAKVNMFRSYFRTIELQMLKLVIKTLRGEQTNLYNRRHKLEHSTAEGLAGLAKLNYIIGASLSHANNRKVFPNESFQNDRSGIMDYAIYKFHSNRVGDNDLRNLAKSEPWRSIWASGRRDGVWGKPSIELTESQRNLTLWSQLYDSIYENSECPPDEVIQDDDILDGWMILKRREGDAERLKRRGEETIGNDKIANSQEVFIMADNIEDARKVESMNSGVAKMIKQQRQATLEQRGEVNHYDFQDKINDVISGRDRIK